MDSQPHQNSIQKPKNWFKAGGITLLALLVVLIAVFIGYGFYDDATSKAEADQAAKEVAGKREATKLLGKKVRLDSDGKGGAIMVSTTVETYEVAAQSLLIREDGTGCEKLFEEGKLEMLPANTFGTVTDINPSGLLCRVHVTSGEHTGEDWWSLTGCCKAD